MKTTSSRLLVAALVVMGSTFSARAASFQSYFLVFNESADVLREMQFLETQGALVRQCIPPRILVADLPRQVSLSSISGLSKSYVSAVPLTEIESFGPLATAAGLQWNRRLVQQATTAGASSMGAMKALMSQQSLPAPENLTVTPSAESLVVTWKAVDGAAYYMVEASEAEFFSTPYVRTRVNQLRVELPLPEGSGSPSIYVRARAVDRPDPLSQDPDVYGRWTAPRQVSASRFAISAALPTPVLTSPLNGYETEGFTVILEWTGLAQQKARVQVALDSGFESIFLDEIAGSEGFLTVPSTALRIGDTYYWRVRAGGNPQGSWSDVRRFRIGAPRPHQADVFINPEAPK